MLGYSQRALEADQSDRSWEGIGSKRDVGKDGRTFHRKVEMQGTARDPVLARYVLPNW